MKVDMANSELRRELGYSWERKRLLVYDISFSMLDNNSSQLRYVFVTKPCILYKLIQVLKAADVSKVTSSIFAGTFLSESGGRCIQEKTLESFNWTSIESSTAFPFPVKHRKARRPCGEMLQGVTAT